MRPKKSLFFISALSVAVLLLLPFVAVNLTGAMNAMGTLIILLLAVNPAAAVIIGAVSGRAFKLLWWVPLAFSVLFLPFYWLILREIVPDLTIYACIYLGLGYASALIYHVLLLRKNKDNAQK